METQKDWTLAKVWNESLGKREERPCEKRDRMFASEFAKSDIDIFMAMNGEKPSNPPNDRSFRKFDAGDIFEWFVKLVLVRAGIFIASQEAVKFNEENLVEVSGRLDYVAGGMPRYSEAHEEIDKLIKLLELPDIFNRVSKNILNYFQENYPDGLKEKIIEVKSVAQFGFDRVEKTNKPLSGHDLQTFHYARNKDKEAAICYICRDDLRMYEIPILPHDVKLEEKYLNKIKRVTEHHKSGEKPALEPVINFDEDLCKFSKNFKVEYSQYLTTLYGFERPDVYDEKYSPIVMRLNRVLGRIAEGKKLTDNNLQALGEMTILGFDADRITALIKEKAAKGEITPEEETTTE